MDWIKKILGVNWRTNLVAVISFLAGVQQFVAAIMAWSHHQPADWRGAILAVIVAAGAALSKDAATHSTQAEVQAATIEKK